MLQLTTEEMQYLADLAKAFLRQREEALRVREAELGRQAEARRT